MDERLIINVRYYYLVDKNTHLNPGFINFSHWLSCKFSEMFPRLQNKGKKQYLCYEVGGGLN